MIRTLLSNYLDHIYENEMPVLIDYRNRDGVLTVWYVVGERKSDIEIDLLELIAYNHLLIIS